MKRSICVLLVVTLLSIALCIPALAENNSEPLVGAYIGYVKTFNFGSLNMRQSPSINGKKMTTIPYGKAVNVFLAYAGDPAWLSIEYKGKTGYVMARYISDNEPAPKPDVKPTPKQTTEQADMAKVFKAIKPVNYKAVVRSSITGSFVHMRWAPDKQMAIMKDFYDGACVDVIAQSDVWCQIREIDSGETGFMLRQFLVPAAVDTAGMSDDATE